jgi:hypothetical protein
MFRGKYLAGLQRLGENGELEFHGDAKRLREEPALRSLLTEASRKKWVVYSKRPFAGPNAVLAYLSRYTHRVAISNRRLINADEDSVTFKVKDYRVVGPGRYTTMTLATAEFIRRFLLHVLPKGFHRIRHYGLLASGAREANLAKARELLAASLSAHTNEEPAASATLATPCPCCGGRMIIIETFEAGCQPQHRPTSQLGAIGIDSS